MGKEKEAGLCVPSGTMGNLAALMADAQPGQEVTMVETGLGQGGNLATATLPAFEQPSDFSATLQSFVEDSVSPAITMAVCGLVRIPEKSGIGFAVPPDSAERYRVRT